MENVEYDMNEVSQEMFGEYMEAYVRKILDSKDESELKKIIRRIYIDGYTDGEMESGYRKGNSVGENFDQGDDKMGELSRIKILCEQGLHSEIPYEEALIRIHEIIMSLGV